MTTRREGSTALPPHSRDVPGRLRFKAPKPPQPWQGLGPRLHQMGLAVAGDDEPYWVPDSATSKRLIL